MAVVSVTSMRLHVLWCGSMRVGEVLVVCRLFSRRKMRKGCVGVRARRLMLMSPCIVIFVSGYR